MCKVDGIEVTREDLPGWDAAVAAFQRNLRGHLRVIRDAAADSLPSQSSVDSDAYMTAAGARSRP